MRMIERSSVFRRDYRREARGQHRATLDGDLTQVLSALADDKLLDAKHRDHALSGDWSGYRECHIMPDLLLIYRKPDEEILQLARLGSHSELLGDTTVQFNAASCASSSFDRPRAGWPTHVFPSLFKHHRGCPILAAFFCRKGGMHHRPHHAPLTPHPDTAASPAP